MAWRMQKKRSLRAAGRIGVDNRGKRGRSRGRGRQRRKTEDGRQKTEGRRQKTAVYKDQNNSRGRRKR
jgi:hypothetical protein